MAVIGGTLGRLPAAVFAVVGLLAFAVLGETFGLKPEDIGHWFGDKVAYDLRTFVVILPALVVFAALIALVLWMGGHHTGAIVAGSICIALFVVAILWYAGLGLWITARLTGTG